MSYTSSVRIKIGNYDYTPFCDYESVSVDNNIVMTSDTMNVDLYINLGVDHILNMATNQMEIAQRPKCGQEIHWENPNLIIQAPNGQMLPYREFGGVVNEVDEDLENGGILFHYTIHARAFDVWLDRHLVTAWYNQDNPENVIKKIVQTYAPTFTTYNVQNTNTQIVPQYFDYRQVSDVIKTIADQMEYGWYIDYFKDVHYYAIESFTSPLPNNILDVENDTTNYGDLTLKENAQQQYNKIFIRGFKTRSTNLLYLTFNGDAQTAQWELGYRPSNLTGDVQVQVYPSMAAYNADTAWANGQNPTGGVSMTIKRDLVDGAPGQGAANNTAYIHFTQHLLRIPNYNNGGLVPSGYVVAIRFHYLKDTVFLAQDPQAQAQTASLEGTDGVYEYAHTDKSLTNSTLGAAESKGQLLLMKYRFPQVTGQFTSYFNTTSSEGFRAGQYFRMKSKRRFGGIDDIFFIQRVTKTIVKNDTDGLVTMYQIEFADSPYLV